MSCEEGFVYVIAGESGPVKIGRSTAPESRLKAVQSGHPHKLEVAYSHRTNFPQAVERSAHEILVDKRLNGEWFDVTVKEAAAAIKLAANKTNREEKARRISARVHKGESGGTELWILLNRLGLTMEMFAELCGMPTEKVTALCRDDLAPPPWTFAILRIYAMLPAGQKSKLFAVKPQPASNQNAETIKKVPRQKWARGLAR